MHRQVHRRQALGCLVVRVQAPVKQALQGRQLLAERCMVNGPARLLHTQGRATPTRTTTSRSIAGAGFEGRGGGAGIEQRGPAKGSGSASPRLAQPGSHERGPLAASKAGATASKGRVVASVVPWCQAAAEAPLLALTLSRAARSASVVALFRASTSPSRAARRSGCSPGGSGAAILARPPRWRRAVLAGGTRTHSCLGRSAGLHGDC